MFVDNEKIDNIYDWFVFSFESIINNP